MKEIDDSDTDSDSIDSCGEQVTKSKKVHMSSAKDDTFEVVPIEKSTKRPRHLDPEGLALGAFLIKIKQRRPHREWL